MKTHGAVTQIGRLALLQEDDDLEVMNENLERAAIDERLPGFSRPYRINAPYEVIHHAELRAKAAGLTLVEFITLLLNVSDTIVPGEVLPVSLLSKQEAE